jgi:hypothetical protein
VASVQHSLSFNPEVKNPKTQNSSNMKLTLVILVVAFVAYSHAVPAQKKRDIGLELQRQAQLARHHGGVHYGNNIEGKDAKIVSEDFERDAIGNYKFQ